MGGQQELMQWGSVGDDGLVRSAQNDIFDTKTLGSGAAFGRGVGILSNAQQEIESNADEISQSLEEGQGGLKSLEDNVMGHGDWESKFAFGRGVLSAVGFNLLF